MKPKKKSSEEGEQCKERKIKGFKSLNCYGGAESVLTKGILPIFWDKNILGDGRLFWPANFLPLLFHKNFLQSPTNFTFILFTTCFLNFTLFDCTWWREYLSLHFSPFVVISYTKRENLQWKEEPHTATRNLTSYIWYFILVAQLASFKLFCSKMYVALERNTWTYNTLQNTR